MTKIDRKLQKLFATGGSNGQFGSAQAGSKQTSTDLDILQGLTAWANGWTDAVISGEKLPPLEEFNALSYVFSQQLKYLFQEGIAEYLITEEYHQNSIVKESGTNKLYSSLIATNIGNVLTDVSKWNFLGDLGGISTTVKGLGFIKKRIIISNNVSDLNNDIDFSAGNFDFSDGSGQAISSSIITKRLDSEWVLGNNQGGLANGLTKTLDTWYHCFALSKADGSVVDFGFDTSETASTLLADPDVISAGLTKYSYKGSVNTDGSNNIRAFIQNERHFKFTTPIPETYDANITLVDKIATLTLPLVKLIPNLSWYWQSGQVGSVFENFIFTSNIEGEYLMPVLSFGNGTSFPTYFDLIANKMIISNAQILYRAETNGAGGLGQGLLVNGYKNLMIE